MALYSLIMLIYH